MTDYDSFVWVCSMYTWYECSQPKKVKKTLMLETNFDNISWWDNVNEYVFDKTPFIHWRLRQWLFIHL